MNLMALAEKAETAKQRLRIATAETHGGSLRGGGATQAHRFFCVVVLAAGCASISATTPAPAVASSKPDLTVNTAWNDEEFAVSGDGSLTISDGTTIRGARRIPKTLTGVSLEGQGSTFELEGGRKVKGNKRYSGGTWTVPLGAVPLGRYRASVCADFKNRISESNEKNNCETASSVAIGRGRISVISRTWHGTVHHSRTLATYNHGNGSTIEPYYTYHTETFESKVMFTLAEGDQIHNYFRYEVSGTLTNGDASCTADLAGSGGLWLDVSGNADYEGGGFIAVPGACTASDDESIVDWWDAGRNPVSLTATEIVGERATVKDNCANLEPGFECTDRPEPHAWRWHLTAGVPGS